MNLLGQGGIWVYIKYKTATTCRYCGKELDREGVMCSKCVEKNNTQSKNKYHERKNAGRCVKCNAVMDTTGAYCMSCKAKKNEEYKLSKQLYLDLGICPRCHKNQLYIDGQKMCEKCSLEHSKHKKTFDANKRASNLEHQREVAKALREQRENSGICIQCGKREAAPGKRRCNECLMYCRRYARSIREKKHSETIGTREYRKQNGLCYQCGETLDNSKWKICTCCHGKLVMQGAKGALKYKNNSGGHAHEQIVQTEQAGTRLLEGKL
jgi:hypothetical protein